MTAATYDAAMVRVFADEGGYTNDPVDPGGATNWGITIFDARKYWQAGATPAEVKAMPKDVASAIYRKHYAEPLRYDDLPAGFDYSVLDAGINSGLGRAVPWAGKALGAPVKSIDDVVPLAVQAPDKVALIQKYWATRLSFLHGLRTWGHFGPGWGKRCANGEAAAVRMWLSVGRGLSNADARSKMDDEAAGAKAQSKQAVGKAAGSAAGSAAPAHPDIDVSQFGLGGRIAVGIAIAIGIALVVYFVRQAIIHNQRAAAYAKA
jgi:lysozyme family protein